MQLDMIILNYEKELMSVPSIPMICPECSAIFEGPAYIDNSSIDMTGALVTCSYCKRNVVPIGGKYEHLNGVLRVIDSEDDDFLNEAINIYLSDMTNKFKLSSIERLFRDKRGVELKEIAGEDYKKRTVKYKLSSILLVISEARNFNEDILFIQEIMQSIFNY